MAPHNNLVVRVRCGREASLGDDVMKFRTWLDREKVQPSRFDTVVRESGYTLVITFRDEDDAARFRRQFEAPLPPAA